MKPIFSLVLLFAFACRGFAQETKEDVANPLKMEISREDSAKKHKNSLSIGPDGIRINTPENDSSDKIFDIQIGMLDLGINYLQDKTNYNSAEVQNFLQPVNSEMRNENLFSLREAKSVNVNVYPVLLKYRVLKTKHQRIYLSTGLGLQMYNFRFNKPLTYINETTPMIVINDSLHFSKNKLAITYLSIPLMLHFKTKLAKDTWVVYGAGITAGYRISSWTKQVSDEQGKQKNHDQFNLNNFNSCVTAELGLEGYFRLYASYQLTALHEDILEQHPYCIGVRFIGI